MPDHVHFFCRAELDAKPLPIFMQKWKQWTSKRMAREVAAIGIGDPDLEQSGTVWQEEFFDHVLRSSGELQSEMGIRKRESSPCWIGEEIR